MFGVQDLGFRALEFRVFRVFRVLGFRAMFEVRGLLLYRLWVYSRV